VCSSHKVGYQIRIDEVESKYNLKEMQEMERQAAAGKEFVSPPGNLFNFDNPEHVKLWQYFL
jgi:hypothetical protein